MILLTVGTSLCKKKKKTKNKKKKQNKTKQKKKNKKQKQKTKTKMEPLESQSNCTILRTVVSFTIHMVSFCLGRSGEFQLIPTELKNSVKMNFGFFFFFFFFFFFKRFGTKRFIPKYIYIYMRRRRTTRKHKFKSWWTKLKFGCFGEFQSVLI